MSKTCTKCGETKPLEQFHVAKKSPDGRKPHCAACGTARTRSWQKANPEKLRATKAASYQRRKAKEATAQRLRKYKITDEQFNAMRAAQRDLCAICNEPFEHTPYVDHCHRTNEVRGLLCRTCNAGLGHFKDNPLLLSSAIEYLA